MVRETQRISALKTIDQLVKLLPDDVAAQNWAAHLRTRFKIPLKTVLAKVPGNNVKERARAIGVSRQCYYCWLNGEYRPNAAQAKRLEHLTGIAADEIR